MKTFIEVEPAEQCKECVELVCDVCGSIADDPGYACWLHGEDGCSKGSLEWYYSPNRAGFQSGNIDLCWKCAKALERVIREKNKELL